MLVDGHELVGLSQATGQPEVQEPTGVIANHFPTPSPSRMACSLVPSLKSVLAFEGPWGLPPAPTPAP